MSFPLEIQHQILSYLPYSIVSKLSVYIPFCVIKGDFWNLLTTRYTKRVFDLYKKKNYNFSSKIKTFIIDFFEHNTCPDNYNELLEYILINIDLKHGLWYNVIEKATKLGYERIVEILAKYVDVFDCCVPIAVKYERLKVLDVLLKHGADVDHACDRIPPLYVAAKKGYFEIAKRLIEAKATITSDMILIAEKAGHVDIANLLIQNSTNLNFDGKLQ